MVGSNCMIRDLDIIARINRLCNDIGIDTMETGAALAVAMEAGFTRAHDRLPAFFSKEQLQSSGLVFDVPEAELDRKNI